METQIILIILLIITVAVIISLYIDSVSEARQMSETETMIYETECIIKQSNELINANLDEPPYDVIRRLQQQEDILENLQSKTTENKGVFAQIGVDDDYIKQLRHRNRLKILQLKRIELKTA